MMDKIDNTSILMFSQVKITLARKTVFINTNAKHSNNWEFDAGIILHQNMIKTFCLILFHNESSHKLFPQISV